MPLWDQRIREFNENIPPLINAYMNLSPTMRVFDTVSNPDFGGVEETGILVTIRDIYPEKRERYTRWLGWQANLQYRRELFRKRVREHLDRIKKRMETQKKMQFIYGEEIVDHILARCKEAESGGRVVDAILTNTMLPDIGRSLLEALYHGQEVKQVTVKLKDGNFDYEFA